MEVQDFILADYAAANDRGKFTLVGAGFSSIAAPQLPFIHPLMFVLVRLKITGLDTGSHRIEIRFVGEEGIIFRAGCDVNVPVTHSGEEFLPLPIQIHNLKFAQEGDYTIEVLINGAEAKSQNLKVIRAV